MHESGIDFDRAAHPQRVYVDSIPDWQLSVVADQVMQGRPQDNDANWLAGPGRRVGKSENLCVVLKRRTSDS